MSREYYRIQKQTPNPKHDGRARYGISSIADFKEGALFSQDTSQGDEWSGKCFWRHPHDGIDLPVSLFDKVDFGSVPLHVRVAVELGDCGPYLFREILDAGLVSFEQLKVLTDKVD